MLIGATPEGRKELVGFTDGARESAHDWRDLLLDLKRRGCLVVFSRQFFLMLARRKSLDALLPILYLRGISTGDFQEALSALLGKDAPKVHAAFRSIVEGVPRTATRTQLEAAAEELSQLADDVLNLLERHIKTQDMSANESRNERHIQNSNPDPLIDLEPGFRGSRAARAVPEPQTPRIAETAYPLGMVLNACPDISDYAKGGISNWRDLLATTAVVRSMLGISPSAWEEAQAVMGEMQAAVVVACILQRGAAIRSAGGYLRGLTERAKVGEFSLGPILMSQINAQLRTKRSA